MMVVASDGNIIDTIGPYIADGNNFTQAFIQKEKLYFKMVWQNDILVWDSGFRESLDIIINWVSVRSESQYVYFLGKRQKQHFVSEANASRLMTKIRWAVESINGRLKRWKLLKNIASNMHIM